MSASLAPPVRAITAGFEKLGVPVLADHPGRWRLMLVNGRPLAATARLDDGWLELALSLAEPFERREPWGWLRASGELPGPGKLIVDDAAVAVRAELCRDLGEATFRRRLSEACEAVVAAARRFEREDRAQLDGLGADASDEGDHWPELVEQLAARRWLARQRAPGRWSVDLAGDGMAPTAAEIVCDAARAATLSVDVAAPRERSPASRAALAGYLLASAGALRLVRAAGDPDGAARFEVRFESEPEASELDEALGALAAAARLAAPAASALESESTSLWYLAARGPTVRASHRSTNRRAERGAGR